MATPPPEHQPPSALTTQGRRLRMSYEEYLAWADEDVHAEWVDGEVIVQAPPKEPHQRVVAFLIQLMGLFIQLFKLGRLLPAPFEMRAVPDSPAREPDLVFVALEHLDRLTEERLSGPADLVVEVISNDSVGRDRADKFYEYQAAGVREYWILDSRPGYERADFYVPDENGRYRPVPVNPDSRYQSTILPGFWLQVEWVTAVEPPAVLTALAQIVGPQKLLEAIGTSMGESEHPPHPTLPPPGGKGYDPAVMAF
jgi:Uma2 family endonuclease